MREKTITGYCNPFSATPGETVGFMISTYAPGDYEAELMRVRAGDDFSDASVGVIEDVVPANFAGRYPGRHQPILSGSYGMIEHGGRIGALGALTVAAWIWPTLPGRRAQTIIGCWDTNRQVGQRHHLISSRHDQGSDAACPPMITPDPGTPGRRSFRLSRT